MAACGTGVCLGERGGAQAERLGVHLGNLPGAAGDTGHPLNGTDPDDLARISRQDAPRGETPS